MYKKGKKLDSKGVIMACVAIIMVCIAVNVAFALVPPAGKADSKTEAAAAKSVRGSNKSAVTGSTSSESADDGADEGGQTVEVDPSIVAVPDNLPEGMTATGFQDVVARYLTTLTKKYGAPEKTLIESSDVNAGAGPDGSDVPYWTLRAYFPNETEIPVTVDYTQGEGFNAGTY